MTAFKRAEYESCCFKVLVRTQVRRCRNRQVTDSIFCYKHGWAADPDEHTREIEARDAASSKRLTRERAKREQFEDV